MDLEDTVIGVIEKASTTESYEQLRALLGQFLFKGDEVEKRIRNLSGGEKARVALCRMMLSPANLLVMDEPTNHLDIPAKEMLEEALQHYEGSMLLVSHDRCGPVLPNAPLVHPPHPVSLTVAFDHRYFISQVATTICAIEDKALALYSGDYRYYIDNRPEVLEKVVARFVSGDSREIGSAKVVEPLETDTGSRKKNFGGTFPSVRLARVPCTDAFGLSQVAEGRPGM
jgi:ATP-binding cassette subfamily F protein 3